MNTKQQRQINTDTLPSDVDAILSSGRLVEAGGFTDVLEGVVSIDFRGRFEAGTNIVTSAVYDRQPAMGGDILTTRNSRYLVLGGLT